MIVGQTTHAPRRKGAQDAADAVGEARRVRAVVGAQADDDGRGRDLRRVARSTCRPCGVVRPVRASHATSRSPSMRDQEGPHAHGERVADHEHGALRRARRGAREGDDPGHEQSRRSLRSASDYE